MTTWTVQTGEIESPLLWLAQRLPLAPQGYLRQLLRGGKLRRNGTVLSESDRLRAGDTVVLPASERLLELLEEQRGEDLTVLLETDRLIVLNKPAGLATHSAVGLERDNLQYLLTLRQQRRGETFRIAPVHRLDRGTSGAVLFGKGKEALRVLGTRWQAASRKFYLALVDGMPPLCGRLESPVLTRGRLRESAASFRRLAQGPEAALLLLELHTGRTHQLRRQLSEIGLPLVGDVRYGGSFAARLGLHAFRLELADPWNGRRHLCMAPVPPDMVALLQQAAVPVPAETDLMMDPAAASPSDVHI